MTYRLPSTESILRVKVIAADINSRELLQLWSIILEKSLFSYLQTNVMNNPFKIYFTFDTLHYIYITLYSTIFFFISPKHQTWFLHVESNILDNETA